MIANLWWLKVALRFWGHILDSGYYLDATPDFLLWDWLANTKEPWVTGVVGNLTSFRFLALGLAAVGLYRMRQEKDPRMPWLFPAIAVPLFIAYFGGPTPGLRQVQPYRFIVPVIMLATVLAGEALDDLVAPVMATLREKKAAGAAIAVLLVLGLPRLARDVQYFIPPLVPTHKKALPLPPPNVSGSIELGMQRWPEPFSYRHSIDPAARELESFVKANDDGTGRWLVEWWMTGEQMAGRTNAQVLGGFREINLAHSDANFFRTHPENTPVNPEAFRHYLEDFNVTWVALVLPLPEIEERRDLLEPVQGPPGARWYRTKIAPSWFVGGGPGTVEARNDRLLVRGSAGGSLVLKYHYLETLRCRPRCTVKMVEVPYTRVGLIGVDGAPPSFEIYNP